MTTRPVCRHTYHGAVWSSPACDTIEHMKMNMLSLSLRFSLFVVIILLLFCALFSTVLYYYLRAQVITEAENKTMIIMTHVRAVGDYVKESLRPRMFDIFSKLHTEDEFVVEAMSTTHVNLQVMKKVSRNLPDYVYKRVSDRPLNPENTAEAFDLRMMDYFRRNREVIERHGREEIGGKKYLIYSRPVFSEQDCLRCHGDTTAVLHVIREKYGLTGKFGWKTGELIGLESVSIPLDKALANAKKMALDSFIFGMGTLTFLFLALYATFRHLVTSPLNRLSGIFRGIAQGTEPLGREISSSRGDEIGDLTGSFNLLSKHLLDAHERLRKAAEIEKQMMQTEKLAALGQLSAGVAHEINNPLGGIRLCFNNLINTEMDAEKKEKHIAVINSGFGRIQSIVRHLLDFAKNAPLCIAPASVNSILENVLNLVGYTIQSKAIAVVRDFAADMPDMPADANKLEQVFLNLIINAVQSMERGGALLIRTRYEAGQCFVSVSDTGKGIPAEMLQKIFDPFFTTKGVGEGTGLGLTVCKAIVEQHRGEIKVETSEKGSTFTVQLPLTI